MFNHRHEACLWCWIKVTLILRLLNGYLARGMILSTTQCYSCMSKDLDKDFDRGLSKIYVPQLKFDDRCNDPFSSKGIPLVNCSTTCAILKEAETKMGILLGHVYIRGCLDKILLKGFNSTALETHKFNFDDICRILPWHQLMNYGTWRTGEVKMCTCYGSKCNKSSVLRNEYCIILLAIIIYWTTR